MKQIPKQLLPVQGVSSIEIGLKATRSAFPDAGIIVVSAPKWTGSFKTRIADSLIVEQPEPRGNAEALNIALRYIKQEGHVLVLNADHLFGLEADELRIMAEQHLNRGMDATIMLDPIIEQIKYYWLYGNDMRLGGRIADLAERSNDILVGAFIGIFMAKIGWLKQIFERQAGVADSQTEAKTTDLLLANNGNSIIGVMISKNQHLGINNMTDYDNLQNII